MFKSRTSVKQHKKQGFHLTRGPQTINFLFVIFSIFYTCLQPSKRNFLFFEDTQQSNGWQRIYSSLFWTAVSFLQLSKGETWADVIPKKDPNELQTKLKKVDMSINGVVSKMEMSQSKKGKILACPTEKTIRANVFCFTFVVLKLSGA